MPSSSPHHCSLPLLLTCLALSLPAGAGEAQLRDRGPLILELPASARSLALGDAFPTTDPGAEGLFYHPGLLTRSEGIGASYQRFGANASLLSMAAGTAWFSGGVAVGIQTLTYEADAEGPVASENILGLSSDEGSLRDEGNTGVSETVLSVGYGRSVLGLRAGVVGKLVQQRFGHRNASTAAADLGLALSPGPLVLALSARNLGPGLTLGGEEIPLPTRFTLGAASRATPIGPLDLAASAALTYRVDGELIPGVGMEVSYWPVTGRTFVARIGYRALPDEQSARPLTFGGAFRGDNLILEYAYLGFESGDPSHRFGVGWR